MDLETVRKEKFHLEVNIANVISPLIKQFKVRTGFSPKEIVIEMIDVTSLSESLPDYYLGPIKVSLATGL